MTENNTVEASIFDALGCCETRVEVRDKKAQLMDADPVLQAAKTRRSIYSAATAAALAAIRQREIAPYEDEAKRWKHGDTVYFGRAANRSVMSMSTLKARRLYDLPKGAACTVYQYQPRKKIAWLCPPGVPCAHHNVIDCAFTLDDLQRGDVSRVELALRKPKAVRDGK